MPKVTIVYHSGFGHTAKQAEAVADGARAGGADVTVVKAEDLADSDSGPWDDLHGADAIIFGSPTYMGSVSGPFETFIDATSKTWYQQGWKNKLAAGFTNSGSLIGDKGQTLHRLITLAMQHGMLWVGTGLISGDPQKPDDPENLNPLGAYEGAASYSANVPPEEMPRAADLATARHLGQRVAEQAARLG
ncbi:MAG: flavodoxin family protein [Pseudomonadota bacterium]